MKNIILLSFLFFITDASAQKDTPPTRPSGNLYGTWLYESGSGGITGKGPGWTSEQGITIQFKRRGCCITRENGKVKSRQRFKIRLQKTQFYEDPVWVIDYKKNQDQLFEIKDKVLLLQDNAVDGFSYRYLRKK